MHRLQLGGRGGGGRRGRRIKGGGHQGVRRSIAWWCAQRGWEDRRERWAKE